MTHLMTAVEAAPIVRLKPRTLLLKARNGEIGCVPGRPVLFSDKHIEDYIARKERPARPSRNPKYARK